MEALKEAVMHHGKTVRIQHRPVSALALSGSRNRTGGGTRRSRLFPLPDAGDGFSHRSPLPLSPASRGRPSHRLFIQDFSL